MLILIKNKYINLFESKKPVFPNSFQSKLALPFLLMAEECKFVKQIYFTDETLSMRSDKTN